MLLACTHYPLLTASFKKTFPNYTQVITQGEIIAESLSDYLQRHPEVENALSKTSGISFYTTDDANDFNEKAKIFYGEEVQSSHISIEE